MKDKYFLFTVDTEEFTFLWDNEDSIRVSQEGLSKLLQLIKKYPIRATFFVTLRFAKASENLIKEIINEGHEIALHGYEDKHKYSKMSEEDAYKYLKESKEKIEELFNIKIKGFRAPGMMPPSYDVIKKLGVEYDSSLHPTYIPGYYNKFFSKRKVFKNNGVVVIPASVTSIFRLSYSWIFFRNFSLAYSKFCSNLTLLDKNFINIYFHPWEFVKLNKSSNGVINKLVIRNTGENLLKKLDSYFSWILKKNIKATTMYEFYENECKKTL